VLALNVLKDERQHFLNECDRLFKYCLKQNLLINGAYCVAHNARSRVYDKYSINTDKQMKN
jgi:hypothetical protein